MSTTPKQQALEARLTEALDKIRLLEALSSHNNADEAIIRHSGYGPDIAIPVDDTTGKTVIVNGTPRQRTVTVPYRIYLSIKANTPWFERGYLYCEADEETLDNPNLILDIKEWVESRTEARIRKDMSAITSEGTLNMIYDYTEKKKGGKFLALRAVAAERLGAVMGTVIIEDSYE